MKKIMFAFLLVLAGCSTTSGLSPTVSQAGFDNSTVVDIVPHGGACISGHCSMVGAQWKSSDPERAILTVGVLSFTKYSLIDKADLRIRSEIFNLVPNPGLTRLQRRLNRGDSFRSYKDFTVPLSVIQEMVLHPEVWVRIHTSDGVVDDAIITRDRDSKAYHALIRFLAEVDARR